MESKKEEDKKTLIEKANDKELEINWIKEKDGATPPEAPIIGFEDNGNDFFLARIAFQNGLYLGKVNSALKAAIFPFDDHEKTSKEYEVYCGTLRPYIYKEAWITYDGGPLPPTAFPFGFTKDGILIYPIRVIPSSTPSMQIGYVKQGETRGIISVNGKVEFVDSYEILVFEKEGQRPPPPPPPPPEPTQNTLYDEDKLINWKWAKNGFIPPNALVVGHENGGQNVYLARVRFLDGWYIGKLRPGLKGAKFGYENIEFELREYEIYCGRMDEKQIKWIIHAGGSLPRNSKPIGYTREGKLIHAIRTIIDGGLQVGYIIRGEKKGRIAMRYGVKMVDKFEVFGIDETTNQ